MEQPGTWFYGMAAGLEPFFSKEDTERGQEEFDEVYGGEKKLVIKSLVI